MIVTEEDCGTLSGIEVSAIKQGQEELLPLRDRIFGRTVVMIFISQEIVQRF